MKIIGDHVFCDWCKIPICRVSQLFRGGLVFCSDRCGKKYYLLKNKEEVE